jgi:putative DNA primase/helicase
VPFTITIPKEKRDRELTERLKLEASGILNWALAGFRDWQSDGLGDPEAVNAATEEYRQSQDVLAHFIDAKVTVAADAEVRVSELYRAYKFWAEESGEFQMTERDFSTALSERGFSKRRVGARADYPAGVYWRGLCVVV